MDPIHPFGEPSLGVDRRGGVFVSGPTGTGTQRSFWEGSVDGGTTYREISPGPVPSALQGTTAPPGGGDTDIAFDNRTPQGQYFADLYALACLRVVKTANEGKTTTQNVYPGGCAGNPPEVDRQWWAIFDPPAGVTSTSAYTGPFPLVYLEYGPAPSHWTKSPGGNISSFSNASSTTHFGADGYPAVDQHTGQVFEANYSGGTIKLNIGTATANGNLCFRDDAVSSTCPAGTGAGSGLITVASTNVVNDSGEAANFVVASMDSAQNLFVVWVNRSNTPTKRQVFVSAASAASGWTSWTPPVQVSDGSGTTGDAVNVFPWIKAGGPGRADAVWYGDSSTLDPSSNSATSSFPIDVSRTLSQRPTGTQ